MIILRQHLFSEREQNEDGDSRQKSKKSKRRKFIDSLNKFNERVNSLKSKRGQVLGYNNSNDILLQNQMAQNSAWQSHVDAVNSHSLATMGMPVM